MTQTQLTYPAILTLCAAAMISAYPLAAVASMPDSQASAAPKAYLIDTDRMIVKYKDAIPSGMRAAMVPQVGTSRMAIAARAGQQLGITMKAIHSTSTGANIFQLDRKMSVADVAKLAAELKARDTSVEYAEPDRILQPLMSQL